MTENVVFHPLKKVIEFLGQNLTNKTLTLEWKKFDIRDKKLDFWTQFDFEFVKKMKKIPIFFIFQKIAKIAKK